MIDPFTSEVYTWSDKYGDILIPKQYLEKYLGNTIIIILLFLLGLTIPRGVQIFQSQSTVNRSWSTAIIGDRGLIIAMNIVT